MLKNRSTLSLSLFLGCAAFVLSACSAEAPQNAAASPAASSPHRGRDLRRASPGRAAVRRPTPTFFPPTSRRSTARGT